MLPGQKASMTIGMILPVLALVCLTMTTSQALAGGNSSARSVAMANAFTALASGIDAARYNPANLGLADYQRTGIELVGVGASITNNAFTLKDYNKYTGAVLTNSDKDYILSRIPDEGLKLSVDAEATVLSAARGNLAFTVTGVGVADVNLSKDIFELVFNGNTFADTINVTGSYSEAVSYVAVGFSYGRPVYNAGTRQLAVGATFKYLRGIAMEEVTELEGMAATYAAGFQGEGRLVARTATGGSGYAVDLGAALKFNDSYTAGIHFKNLLSHLGWSKGTEEHGYIFEFDTMTVDNMEDDYVVSDDYTKEIGNFSTRLPAVMTIGFANTSGKLLWTVDWEQGFSSAPGASTKPRLAAGVEWSPIKAFPLRAGYTIGGGRNSALSLGSGIHLSPFYFDYAVVSGSSFSGSSSKGLNVAISTGLLF